MVVYGSFPDIWPLRTYLDQLQGILIYQGILFTCGSACWDGLYYCNVGIWSPPTIHLVRNVSGHIYDAHITDILPLLRILVAVLWAEVCIGSLFFVSLFFYRYTLFTLHSYSHFTWYPIHTLHFFGNGHTKTLVPLRTTHNSNKNTRFHSVDYEYMVT